MKDEKTYSEKLKDPRWQKKRLEIMQRDEWKCQGCLNDERMLNVHHLKYISGLEPWEYEDKYYMTLCDNCHQAAHFDIEIRQTRESFNIDYFVDFIEPVWSRVYISEIEFHKGDTIIYLRDNYTLNSVHVYNLIKLFGRLKRFIERDSECSLFLKLGDGINDKVSIFDMIVSSGSCRNELPSHWDEFNNSDELETKINGKEIH